MQKSSHSCFTLCLLTVFFTTVSATILNTNLILSFITEHLNNFWQKLKHKNKYTHRDTILHPGPLYNGSHPWTICPLASGWAMGVSQDLRSEESELEIFISFQPPSKESKPSLYTFLLGITLISNSMLFIPDKLTITYPSFKNVNYHI